MDKIELSQENDIIRARQIIRDLADECHFPIVTKTQIATAVGELSRNTIIHGGGGYMEYEAVKNSGRKGVKCHFVDHGPGYFFTQEKIVRSNEPSLGYGLLAVRRLVDIFEIESDRGKGTSIVVLKWSDSNAF